jgi:hypothetical protein
MWRAARSATYYSKGLRTEPGRKEIRVAAGKEVVILAEMLAKYSVS